jgi:hypothetical protein
MLSRFPGNPYLSIAERSGKLIPIKKIDITLLIDLIISGRAPRRPQSAVDICTEGRQLKKKFNVYQQ